MALYLEERGVFIEKIDILEMIEEKREEKLPREPILKEIEKESFTHQKTIEQQIEEKTEKNVKEEIQQKIETPAKEEKIEVPPLQLVKEKPKENIPPLNQGFAPIQAETKNPLFSLQDIEIIEQKPQPEKESLPQLEVTPQKRKKTVLRIAIIVLSIVLLSLVLALLLRFFYK
jgi:hypothetical protein